METAYRDFLNEEETRLLFGLTETCNKNDGTRYSAPCDADIFFLLRDEGKLAAALCAYHMGAENGGQAVDEIYAFTLPEFRRRGYFSRLFSLAEPVLRESLSLPVYEACPESRAVLSHLGARKDRDEYFMELCLEDLPSASPSEKSSLPGEPCLDMKIKADALSPTELFVSSKFCECSLMRHREDTAYLFGMLTYAKYQRRGYGFRFLTEVLTGLKSSEFSFPGDSPPKKIFLQTSSDNPAAVGLYKKCGFYVKEILSFYILTKKEVRILP